MTDIPPNVAGLYLNLTADADFDLQLYAAYAANVGVPSLPSATRSSAAHARRAATHPSTGTAAPPRPRTSAAPPQAPHRAAAPQGLGWLLTRRLWGELKGKWPDEKGFWDDW